MDVSTIVFWLVLLGLVIYVISIYNTLVRLKNRFLNAFAQIEVQLKRRYDLIPNLVETAKAYMSHERETLEAVTAARNDAAAILKGMSAGNVGGAEIAKLASAENAGSCSPQTMSDGIGAASAGRSKASMPFSIWSIAIHSSAVCACAILPGPKTIMFSRSVSSPPSVPYETVCAVSWPVSSNASRTTLAFGSV